MALGTSLFLIAVGAVLRFAVSVSPNGFNIQTVGVILMIVGGVGLAISLFWMVVWADRRRGAVPPDDRYGAPGDRYVAPGERRPGDRYAGDRY
jgi:protein-S-isoprenylcysteine O-methyltransferase Ste14